MTCFDKSVYLKDNSSPARTYHTYMCQSRDSYSSEHKNQLLQRHDNYDYIWTQPSDKPAHKPPHISKLRHILSETISNITKGDSLKQVNTSLQMHVL